MLPSPLNSSAIYTNNSLVPNICQSQYFNRFVECYRLCLRTTQLNSGVSSGLVFVSSSRGLQLRRALHWGTPSEEESNIWEFKELNSSYLEGEPSAKESNLNNFVAETTSDMNKNEILRRKKIGLANKGRIPWNKGKKHTAETRELISQRTKEALKDPKVRKKMSECPRTLSDQTKAKIRTTITRQWRERLKWKKSREKFISQWAESIANAAKKGGIGQQELDWDSYEKIEREIALQHLQRSADVAKAKEMAQIRAERRAKAKAEKAKLTLQKRMAKVKGLAKKKPSKKSKEEKEELAAAEDLKLKERLTKIHRKKSVNDQLSSRDHRAWERLDLKFLREDTRKNDKSLADQIRDVKNKKAGVSITGVLTATPPNHQSGQIR
ncbi:stress response protein NST1 [Cynara cardunculus var. scolymus]|uniref:stress response protein NST1 n=1 Tax=Cynara cardunculus var. scolymus TaxID=59895 RepID=UPI000D626B67|nr:stress response protein NST1 [Cynara cardunculus var. scolymus]